MTVRLPRGGAGARAMTTAELRAAGRELMGTWTRAARELVPAGEQVVDAHAHEGVDIDGSAITAERLVADMDAAGVAVAAITPLAQADGYAAENERLRELAAASAGRFVALHRVDPAGGDPAGDARRALAAGARGLKWHPRAEAFGMDHPAAGATAAAAAEAGAPVLIHAGRGMPHLGAGVLDLAREHAGATFILAHAAVSDLAWILDASRELDNVVFDTSWWRPWDIAVLLAGAAPGRVLHGSDPPYGTMALGLQVTARVARACGYDDDAMRSLMGGEAARCYRLDGAGDEPLAARGGGPRCWPEEDPDLRRAASYLESGMQARFVGGDASESFALARCALRVPDSHPHAEAATVLAGAIAVVDVLLQREPEDDALGSAFGWPAVHGEAVELGICALAHCSTPGLHVAGAELLA